jgi:probable enterotoxin B
VIDGNTTTATTETTVSGKVKATTNVNVRKEASQTSTKLGTAVAGNTYELLGVEGEWYKINFNGSTGYGKAEYFEKQ